MSCVVVGTCGRFPTHTPDGWVCRFCPFDLCGARGLWQRLLRHGRTNCSCQTDQQPLRPFGLFKAGLSGVVGARFAFFTTAGAYRLMRLGEFGSLIGNLWGPLTIFWIVFGALVSAGLALLFYAWPGVGGVRMPHS